MPRRRAHLANLFILWGGLWPVGCGSADRVSHADDLVPPRSVIFANGENGFTDVRTAAVVFDTLIAVADNYSDKVLLFRDTHLVGAAGGTGAGPLEFLDVAALVPAGDALVVYDRQQQRLTILDSGLVPLRMLRVPERALYLAAFQLGARGVALIEAAPRADLSLLWTTDVFTYDSVAWSTRSVLQLVPWPTGKVDPWNGVHFGGAGSGRLRIAWPDEDYVIYSVDPITGDQGIAAQRDLAKPSKTSREREVSRELSRRAGEMLGSAASDRATGPHPHFSQHVEDPCGRIWVLTRRGGDHETVVDVFQPGGTLLREVNLEGYVVGIAGFLRSATLVTITMDEMGRRGIALFDLPSAGGCTSE